MIQQMASVFLKHKYREILKAQNDPIKTQEAAFQKLKRTIMANSKGPAHEICHAKNLKEFAELAQSRTYEDYRSAIENQCSGEDAQLFKDQLVYVGLSSATTSPKSKAMPYNQRLIKAWENFQLSMASIIEASTPVKMIDHERLNWGSTPIVEYFKDEIPGGYVSGFLSMKSPRLIRRRMFPKLNTLLNPSMETKTKAMESELLSTDIRLISGVPSYLVNLLESLRAGWGVDDLSSFFPNLQTCVYSSTPIHVWRDQIDKLIGRPLNYIGCYAATEGVFGYEIPELNGGQNGVYSFHLQDFVFLFKKRGAEGRIVSMADLREGDEVELLLSSPNGLVNYAMGDLLRIQSVKPNILFEVLGRIGQGMNIAAEKVSADEIQRAISKVAKSKSVPLRHFFVHPAFSSSGEPNYSWKLCLDEERDDLKEEDLSLAIDQALMEINDDYEESRLELGFIGPPQIEILKSVSIKKYFQERSFKGQLKLKSIFDSSEEFWSYWNEIQT